MHCPIVVLILQCIVAQYCDLHTRDRYTAEAGLEDAATAWCWAVCDPTSEVWSCCGAGCSVQLSLALTTGRHTVYSEHTLLLDTSIYTFIVGYPPLDILSSI